ncbi:autotransporter outer membrane beta-barrel domain-containing protein [Salinispora oceanensis]|uniref:right-handed parallel beta-helix repeat-containing protein n=1 Tax=Salinispora oceanensis TaxID=1050199 RepID=UPI00036D6472|nr:right-handed parallel beta-helix repeat-containing protein [Salinispora oceanensis]
MAGSSPFTGKDVEIAMNHQRQERELCRSGLRRAGARWWAVGLAGVAGLALTATTVGAFGGPAAGAVGGAFAAADDQPEKSDRRTAEGHRTEGKADGEVQGKKREKSKGIPVPCDADKLIAAITLANARGGATLDLASKCTYLLTANLDGSGLPAITTPITLNGGKHTIIERAAAVEQFRILTVDVGGDLTLNHLTITGGYADTDGGGILVNTGGALTTKHSTITRNIAGDNGGGIANDGTTLVKHSTVSRNTSGILGGGISSSGVLEVTDSGVRANVTAAGGGVATTGSALVQHSTISDNSAQDVVGGIIVNGGSAVVEDSSVSGNTANGAVGGILANVGTQVYLSSVTLADNVAGELAGALAIETGGTMTVTDSTVENNRASTNGGGIYNADELTLLNTKIVGNQADLGGGIYNVATGTAALYNTKVIKNIAVTDGGGIYNEAGGTVLLNPATGTVVIKNRPNNCSGIVPDCAG